MQLEVTKKQQAFISATADEVLFGGAAGGGKSHGILIDLFLYALQYAGSRQLALRRTFPELEESLILESVKMYPVEVASYNDSRHRWTFKNGSTIRFGYLNSDKDVTIYQSAQYDRIFFDELTHFTAFMYEYMQSRVRGVTPYPRQTKAGTNPGGIGHSWVKERFVDAATPGTVFETENEEGEVSTRLFIPSLVQENKFLMEGDPGYIRRLKNLPERERRALLDGDWDAFEGQFFKEFDRAVHVCRPFVIPEHWRIYRTIDYGLDMLACLWVAVDEFGRAVVYKELYEPDLIVSAAAARILEVNGEDEVYLTLAPRDLWNRRQESGRGAANTFAQHGVPLT
ncbi:terminase family protein, partial [Clostridia bacterium OttesenSCG-928-O13]|nr:terminase family protein [Clostridia bacterium OttesenSCG-928-O13]